MNKLLWITGITISVTLLITSTPNLAKAYGCSSSSSTHSEGSSTHISGKSGGCSTSSSSSSTASIGVPFATGPNADASSSSTGQSSSSSAGGTQTSCSSGTSDQLASIAGSTSRTGSCTLETH